METSAFIKNSGFLLRLVMISQKDSKRRETTIERVREILKRYPASRDTDAYLIWLYLRKHHGLKLPFLGFRHFYELHLETIRRARQKIQRSGKYLPRDPEVQKERGKKNLNRGREPSGFN